MKKLSIVFLLAVFSLIGSQAHANDGLGLDGSLYMGDEVKAETQLKLRDRNITNDARLYLTPEQEKNYRNKIELEGKMNMEREQENEEHNGMRGEFRTNAGLHLGEMLKVRNIHERAKIRFEVSIQRIEQIQTRIQSRIDKMKLESKDTASAQASLDISKAKLAEAKSFTAQVKLIIDPHITSDPKTELSDAHKAEVKILLEKAKASIKVSFDALKDALKALKNITS